MDAENPFILAGYTQEQAKQLTEIASQYPQVGISADEATQMMIKALLPFTSKENSLEELNKYMNKETIKNQIEEWFCEANTNDGMFAISEIYALLYNEAKRNLRYWVDAYKYTDKQLREKLYQTTGCRGFPNIDSK